MEKIVFTTEWDKVFKKDENVEHKKVCFNNHFGITLVADLYWPKNLKEKVAGLAISGPFGAVKEQSSGLYAQEMARRGYVSLAFDPSFTGESGGNVRYMNSPDINVEDFQAAIDYLSNLDMVDSNKIGIIGICGWGGMALQTACIDTRIKVTICSTMYDMSRVTGNGYFDESDNADARYQQRVAINNQRTIDFKNGNYKLGGGVVDDPTNMPWFVQQYYDYYKTKRGYHKRSLNSNGGWNVTAATSLLNTRLFYYAKEIRSAVLIVHGEKAHSLYFSKDAYKLLEGDNKELFIVPGATHCDLYDQMDKIPFDKMEAFLKKYL